MTTENIECVAYRCPSKVIGEPEAVSGGWTRVVCDMASDSAYLGKTAYLCPTCTNKYLVPCTLRQVPSSN